MKVLFYALLVVAGYASCSAMEANIKVIGIDAYTHAVEQNKVTYFNDIGRLIPLNAESASKLLLIAIQKGHTDFIRPLLLKKADVNYQKGTPLKIAVRNSNLKLIEQLIHAGADPKLLCDRDFNLVHDDVKNYFQEIAEKPVNESKDDEKKQIIEKIDGFCSNWQLQIEESLFSTINQLLWENESDLEKRITHLKNTFLEEHEEEITKEKASAALIGSLFEAVVHKLLAEQAINEKSEAPKQSHYAHLLLTNPAAKILCTLAGQNEITAHELLPHLLEDAKKSTNLTYSLICLMYTIACKAGNLSFIRTLLDCHILPVQEPGTLNSPLMEAIEAGYPDIVTLFLTHPNTKDSVMQLITQKNSLGETPLIVACSKNHLELEDDVYCHTQNEEKARKLLAAYADIVLMLLNNNAPINETDNKGRTAFVHALFAQHMPIIDALLNNPRCNQNNKPQDPDDFKSENSLILNFKNDRKRTPAMLVCMEDDDPEPIKILIEKKARFKEETEQQVYSRYSTYSYTQRVFASIKDVDGFTPYLHAAALGNHKIMKALHGQKIQNSEILNEKNNDAHHALHLACKNGHVEAAEAFLNYLPTEYDHYAKKLLCQNYDWYQTGDKDQLNALCLAARNGHNNVLIALLNFAEKNKEATHPLSVVNWRGDSTALNCAMQAKKYGTADLLRKYEARAFDRDSKGMTPIAYAAQDGNLGLLKLFLDKYYDTNMWQHRPEIEQALICAIKAGKIDIIDWLCSRYKLRMYLHLALAQKQYEAAKILLKYNAKPFAKDAEDKSGLDYAAEQGQTELIKQFLDAKIQKLINKKKAEWIQTDNGKVLQHTHWNQRHAIDELAGTALLFAAQAGQLDTVKLLCESYGASLTVTTAWWPHKNALELAEQAQKQGVVDYLKAKRDALKKVS